MRAPIELDAPKRHLHYRHMKPLFIPLKTEWFDAFADGSKTVEYRRYGRQWTEEHCRVGRPVILSKGYSGPRLRSRVVGFSTRVMDTDIYGKGVLLACIRIAPLR